MFREITENTLSKAKEEIVIPQGIVVLIAVVAFVTGLVVGILCSSGSKRTKRKRRKSSFNADAYVRDLNFDIDDNDDDGDDEGYEFSF